MKRKHSAKKFEKFNKSRLERRINWKRTMQGWKLSDGDKLVVNMDDLVYKTE
jgi:hypothetical protein